MIYVCADIDIQISGSLQLWFCQRNYLKLSWSYILCALKEEQGFGQRKMFIKIESKTHVIISVFLGAMVLLTATSSICCSLLFLCSWKKGVKREPGLCRRIKIEFWYLIASRKFSEWLQVTYDHDYYINIHDTSGQWFKISFLSFLKRKTED